MENKRKIFGFLFMFLFLFICSIISYFGLWKVFFQQDEWFAFGEAIYANHAGIGSLLGVSGFHFVPLATFFIYFFYNFFHLNYYYYAWLAIVLHALNAFLVFILGYKIIGNKKTSLLASILFTFANTGQQAVSWFATIFSVLPATFFVLLSLILFSEFVRRKKIYQLILSLLTLSAALLFKEDAMFFFFIYIGWLFSIKGRVSHKVFFLIAGNWFIYFFLRILLQLSNKDHTKMSFTSAVYVQNFVIHILIFPLKGFVQTIFSQKLLLDLSRAIININQNFFLSISPIKSLELFAELYVVNFVIFSCLILFFLVFLFFFKKAKNKERNTSYLLISFTSFSLISLIFLPPSLDIESRHLYLPMVGGSLLIAFLWSHLYKIKDLQIRLGMLAILCIFIFYNIIANHDQIVLLNLQSASRISLVSQIQKWYGKMPEKTIFLAQGDPLPLQSGPGQTLLVLLSDKNDYSVFLRNNFLWDINNGYEARNARGFGFFYDKQLFLDAYMKNHLRPENVFSFTWDAKTSKLTDTTKQTRETLQ